MLDAKQECSKQVFFFPAIIEKNPEIIRDWFISLRF